MKYYSTLKMITILIIIIAPTVSSFAKETINSSDGFRILFWDYESGKLDKEITDLTYLQLMKKLKPLDILTEDMINKYYWDEQVLEINLEKYRNDTGHWIIGESSGFFTIVLNNDVLYHGISRIIEPEFKQKYDDSDYPALIHNMTNKENIILIALKPKYEPAPALFNYYDEKEQNKILIKKVLEYFKKQGKIVRGKIDFKAIYWNKKKN